MKINIEKEYKILLNEKQFYTLLDMYPNAVFKTQTNTYYDTIGFDIRKNKGAMRIRQMEDQTCIFTLKLFRNNELLEFEKNVSKNDASIFQDEEICLLLEEYDLTGPFHELTSLTTKRAIMVTDDAELCFDINYYHDKIDFEVEYEYKRDHDGIHVFNNILAAISLTYETNCESKIKRAMDSL